MRPSRPSVRFPRYTTESSATAIEERPWFDDAAGGEREPPLAETKPMPAVRAMARSGRPAVPRPAPRRCDVPDEATEIEFVFQPKVEVAETTATTQLRPMAASAAALKPLGGPELPPAPTWVLPPVPTVTAPVPEKRELPSFGPVAFDLDPRMTLRISYKPDAPLSPRRLSPLALGVACALGTLAWLVTRFVVTPDAAIAPAMASPATEPVAIAAIAEPPPPVAQPSLEAPLAALAPIAPAERPSLAPLTPEQIFAPAEPSKPPPVRKLTRQEQDDYRKARARLSADLVLRNSPAVVGAVPVTGLPSGARRTATLDELLRTPPLRGERD